MLLHPSRFAALLNGDGQFLDPEGLQRRLERRAIGAETDGDDAVDHGCDKAVFRRGAALAAAAEACGHWSLVLGNRRVRGSEACP